MLSEEMAYRTNIRRNQKVAANKRRSKVRILFWFGVKINRFCQAAICSSGFIWQIAAVPMVGQFVICPPEFIFIQERPGPKKSTSKKAMMPKRRRERISF